jgi:hypothetical protein
VRRFTVTALTSRRLRRIALGATGLAVRCGRHLRPLPAEGHGQVTSPPAASTSPSTRKGPASARRCTHECWCGGGADPVLGPLGDYYWSATTQPGLPDVAWVLSFQDGSRATAAKDGTFNVRAVRAGL